MLQGTNPTALVLTLTLCFFPARLIVRGVGHDSCSFFKPQEKIVSRMKKIATKMFPVPQAVVENQLKGCTAG